MFLTQGQLLNGEQSNAAHMEKNSFSLLKRGTIIKNTASLEVTHPTSLGARSSTT